MAKNIQTKLGTFTIADTDEGASLIVEKNEPQQVFTLKVINKTNGTETELRF